jgi:multimeric flavodoxin WrbA
MGKVLGISGSPVKDSNTDTLVKTILESTGLDQDFVKLSEIEVAPCRACKKCAYTNQCVWDDDFKWLSQMVLDADALVIGTPVMYGSASGFTKAFIERLWSLRHVKLLTQGKIGATAVVGWVSTEDVINWLNQVMMVSGFKLVGSVIGHGSPGCFTCGPGETCSYSIWNSLKKTYKILESSSIKNQPESMEKVKEIEKMMDSQENIYKGYLEELADNDPLKNPSYNVLKCISVKDQPETMEKAKGIGKLIYAKLKSKE